MTKNRATLDYSPPTGPDVFVCECYLRSKAFESRIEIALDSSLEEKRQFIDMWMQMMITGLGIKAKTHMGVTVEQFYAGTDKDPTT